MTIFYSWQSDIENQRSQIQKTLESSIKKIKKEFFLDICVDRDTKGKSGAVNIVESIFHKIDSCRIFGAAN